MNGMNMRTAPKAEASTKTKLDKQLFLVEKDVKFIVFAEVRLGGCCNQKFSLKF